MQFVIKRDGTKQEFDVNKIINAVEMAFKDVENEVSGSAHKIAISIAQIISSIPETLTVEQIQDKVEDMLMSLYRKDIARAYIQWRYKRSIIRRENTTDKSLMELLYGKNEYWKDENSNKNSTVVHTQRDYIAGITSTDITRRLLLSEDIVDAHDKGIIHFHDADYFAQNVLTNCCLINLDDMLQNGTCINGVYIDKPHRLMTASTIATQIITAVSSSQYGGCTISLSHLAPFVNSSRVYYRNYYSNKISNKQELDNLIDELVRKEIKDSIQTLNYQINSMTTTNGQAPFISVCMYLNEVDDELTKNDLALLIEQMLKQRILGFKNKKGVYITPAFPKLLYFLEEDNIHPESKYYYLTKLACECTAKRMVPDFISEKMMKELKGDVYPCMGAVASYEVVTYKINDNLYVESFERFWDRMSKIINPVGQFNISDNPNLCIDTEHNIENVNVNVSIFDTERQEFVKVKKLVRNITNEWVKVTLSQGRYITCTLDHPFPTNRGRVEAKDLLINDTIPISTKQYSENSIQYNSDKAWLLGFILCDGCYQRQLSSTIAMYDEDDILENYVRIMKDVCHLDVTVKEWHRGVKGNYKELKVDNCDGRKLFINELVNLFGGIPKINRHIPNEVFSWDNQSKLSFLAGMIDADGYINPKSGMVQIGSTNRELALQQSLLAQSLEMQASIYINHYNKNKSDNVRYRVEFSPTSELLNYIVCQKKLRNYENSNKTQHFISNISSIVKIERFNNSGYSYDVETESDHFEVSGIYSHNCRSFLTPDRTTSNLGKALNYNGKHKYYGRFNQGVVTINLVDVALSSNKDFDKFEQLFNERLELCHKALRIRHDRLTHGISDMAPIMWQDGALARLDKNESIKDLLYDGYSTISLGYAGLYECVKYMTGESLTSNKGKEFALHVMEKMNEKTKEWKSKENIDYSVYGTPIESTTYKFASNLKQRFGNDVFINIDGRDRNYITNSYHIPVFEPIDPFDKLKIESEFQKLSPGGAISYIECADLTKNTEAVMSVVQFIYDNIMYAELNTKSDYCQSCGYDGEIKIIDKDNKLMWKCPNCGNMDQTKMNVARRTCGYIGTNFFNQGRTNEIKDRYVHLDDHNMSLE